MGKSKKSGGKTKLAMFFVGFLLVAGLAFGAAWGFKYYYNENLKPVSQTEQAVEIEVASGATLDNIADQLHESGLIRSRWVFKRYVRSQDAENRLLAGTYSLSPSQSVEEILAVLTGGVVQTDLVTILPGQTLEQIKDDLVESGFDEAAVEAALDPANYADHQALADKPAGASLAGYLYPESFHRDAGTTPATIIRQSLDEMAKRLTPAVRQAIISRGLSVHEGIILASIVEGEVNDPHADKLDEKRQIAQVFYRRLSQNYRLESDAARQPGHDTYQVAGLPPAPLTNVSQTSLEAVANPSSTSYFFFVTNADCVTRFSNTFAEHQAKIRQYGVNRTRIC